VVVVVADEPAEPDRLAVARDRAAVARDRAAVAREPAGGHAQIVRRRLAGRVAETDRVEADRGLAADPTSEAGQAADPGLAVDRTLGGGPGLVDRALLAGLELVVGLGLVADRTSVVPAVDRILEDGPALAVDRTSLAGRGWAAAQAARPCLPPDRTLEGGQELAAGRDLAAGQASTSDPVSVTARGCQRYLPSVLEPLEPP
jgi:hypothetical protein